MTSYRTCSTFCTFPLTFGPGSIPVTFLGFGFPLTSCQVVTDLFGGVSLHHQVLQIVFVSTPSLIYMGHAMHIVRREEKRSREAELQEEVEGGGREDDPGGGGGGGGGGRVKGGKKNVKGERDEGGGEKGRIPLRGPLLQTYIFSILIRSVMEVSLTGGVRHLVSEPC